jgi:hypothetical protein
MAQWSSQVTDYKCVTGRQDMRPGLDRASNQIDQLAIAKRNVLDPPSRTD